MNVTMHLLYNLKNDLSINVNFNFDKDNFYFSGTYYTFDRDYKIIQGKFYRICNAFMFKLPKKVKRVHLPIFFLVEGNIYHTIIKRSKDVYTTNMAIKSLKDIIDDKEMLYYVLQKYYALSPPETQNKIIQEYILGKGYAEIAKKMGVSRQRIEQIAGRYTFINVSNLTRLFNSYIKIKNMINDTYNKTIQYLRSIPEYNNVTLKFFALGSPFYRKDDRNVALYFFKDGYLYLVNTFYLNTIPTKLNNYFIFYFPSKYYKFVENNDLETKTKYLILFNYNGKVKIIEKQYLNVKRQIYINKKYLDMYDYLNVDELIYSKSNEIIETIDNIKKMA